MEEQWQPIPDYEGHYEASNLGQIRSVRRAVQSHSDGRIRTFQGRILQPELRSNTGYYVVNLSQQGITQKHYVHRLVLMAFVGPPDEGQECCHNNDVRTAQSAR